jgi:hypothetical protein
VTATATATLEGHTLSQEVRTGTMNHSIGDGIIVAALAAAFIAYIYFKHLERQRRLEIVHQERLVAMEKGIPLPELPLDPPKTRTPSDPRAPLVHGIVWTALGGGSMIALGLVGGNVDLPPLWPFAFPFVLLGVGLMLYYFLAVGRPS